MIIIFCTLINIAYESQLLGIELSSWKMRISEAASTTNKLSSSFFLFLLVYCLSLFAFRFATLQSTTEAGLLFLDLSVEV